MPVKPQCSSDVEFQLACFTPTDITIAPTNVFVAFVMNSDGSPKAVYYTDEGGSVIDVSTYLGGGVVNPGSCAINTQIVEGCIDDPAGGTQIALSGVNALTGALVWGPVPKDTLGFVSCCGDNVVAAFCMEGFDYYSDSDYTAGQTTSFEVFVDGVSQGTLAIDYLAISDGVNKSSWYAPLISLVNSSTNWTMSVNTDAGVSTSTRPIWSFDYNGPGGETLVIEQNGNETRTMTVNTDGTTSTSTDQGGSPFGTDPFDVTCV